MRHFALVPALLLSAVFFFLTWRTISGVDSYSLPMSLTVSDRLNIVGFDVNTSALTFGRMGRGASSQRSIIITNAESRGREVWLSAEGPLAPWVSLSRNHFILQGNAQEEISATLYVPTDALPSNYSGKVNVLFKKI
ncbi:hypothetical protein HYU14_03600 [Candidatus Woesearchaeota archaeon]|nr:hypothetical protein [Candidatus Woesearchaeota archaeon]